MFAEDVHFPESTIPFSGIKQDGVLNIVRFHIRTISDIAEDAYGTSDDQSAQLFLPSTGILIFSPHGFLYDLANILLA